MRKIFSVTASLVIGLSLAMGCFDINGDGEFSQADYDLGFNYGYGDGSNDGYGQGVVDGQNQTYLDYYDQGYIEGYNAEYEIWYILGYEAYFSCPTCKNKKSRQTQRPIDYDNGYNAGYNQGYLDYYDSGYADGYVDQTYIDAGYYDGYAQGLVDGQNAGYTDGYNQAAADDNCFNCKTKAGEPLAIPAGLTGVPLDALLANRALVSQPGGKLEQLRAQFADLLNDK